MAKPRLVTLNLAGQATKTETMEVYIAPDGTLTKKDTEGAKTVNQAVTLLTGIANVENLTSLFGSLESALKFVVSKVNTQLKAEAKTTALAIHAGPEKIIAETLDKLRKANTPADVMATIEASMRATLIVPVADTNDEDES